MQLKNKNKTMQHPGTATHKSNRFAESPTCWEGLEDRLYQISKGVNKVRQTPASSGCSESTQRNGDVSCQAHCYPRRRKMMSA